MAEQADAAGKNEKKVIKTTKGNESCGCTGETMRKFRK